MATKRNKNWFFLDIAAKDRLRRNHFPSEDTMRDFIESSAFHNETASTASASLQGLAKKASDAKAVARNSTPDADGFTQFLLAHQLPYIEPLNATTAIAIAEASASDNRTGGSGLNITVENTLGITSTGTILVTQVNPGDDAIIDIAALGVKNAYIGPDAITEDKIADTAVRSEHIHSSVRGAGLTYTLGVLSVNVDNSTVELNGDILRVKPLGITSGDLAALSVIAGKIAANAVTATEIATNAVTSTKINALAVTTAKIALLAVDTAQLALNSVDSTILAANAVTATELAANAVTTVKILDLNVTTAKLANNAVTAAKIAANTITSAEVAVDGIKEVAMDNSYTKGILTAVCSFETNEVGTVAIQLPFNCTIDYIYADVTTVIAGTDNGSLQCNLDGNVMDTITITLGSGVGTPFTDGGLANNTVSYNPLQTTLLELITSKVTAGGRLLVSVGYTINDEV